MLGVWAENRWHIAIEQKLMKSNLYSCGLCLGKTIRGDKLLRFYQGSGGKKQFPVGEACSEELWLKGAIDIDGSHCPPTTQQQASRTYLLPFWLISWQCHWPNPFGRYRVWMPRQWHPEVSLLGHSAGWRMVENGLREVQRIPAQIFSKMGGLNMLKLPQKAHRWL